MEFAFNILILLLLSPIAYVVAYLRYGKLFKALYALLMSPYMLIPFIWLSIATQWQIGIAALLTYGLVGFWINLSIQSRFMKAMENMSEEEIEKTTEKGVNVVGNLTEDGFDNLRPIRLVFRTAFRIASAY